jgi:hypothetical protein
MLESYPKISSWCIKVKDKYVEFNIFVLMCRESNKPEGSYSKLLPKKGGIDSGKSF